MTPKEKTKIVVEASTVGLKPGQWPIILLYDKVMWARASYNRDGPNNEVTSVTYEGNMGKAELEVLND
jgi:hypothetical protein